MSGLTAHPQRWLGLASWHLGDHTWLKVDKKYSSPSVCHMPHGPVGNHTQS